MNSVLMQVVFMMVATVALAIAKILPIHVTNMVVIAAIVQIQILVIG
jgi:hypothetical protein